MSANKPDARARLRALGAAWNWTFARYLVVGAANTAFAYTVYALALYAGARYPVASLIALVAGIVFSFKTHGTLVFRNARNSLFGRFVLVWVLAYACNIGLITLFMQFGPDAFVAGALALPFNVLLGYFLQRYYVFAERA